MQGIEGTPSCSDSPRYIPHPKLFGHVNGNGSWNPEGAVRYGEEARRGPAGSRPRPILLSTDHVDCQVLS